MMFPPEPFDAAQHRDGGYLLPAVQIDEGIADEHAVGSLALTEVTGQLDALRIHNGAPDQTVERVGRTMHPDLLPSRWAEQKPSTAEAAVREAMVSASGHHLTDTRLLNGAPPGQFPKPVTPPGQYGRLARRPY
jgi:hypothetical protein